MKLFEQNDLFVSGDNGYHTYRIPALVVSRKGTVFAFCEGRKYGQGDAGKIDILLKQSFDNGKTWSEIQVVAAEDDMTCGNPCPVVDQQNGTIWLPFCKNLAEGDEGLIIQGKAPRTVWITWSADDGSTWSKPKEITQDVKNPSWTWYATGPGHGIQLKNGRLLIPCDHVVGRNFTPEYPYHSHVIYSDDSGQTWKIGGIIDEGTNECAIIETMDGYVYINCRNKHGDIKKRAFAWSHDGGESFSPLERDEALIEPICQASLARLTTEKKHDRNRVLFANPASTERKNMTVRISYDEGKSWSIGKPLYEGPSAYSDMAVTNDMTICCLYERGSEHPYEKLTFFLFNLEWLTNGKDWLKKYHSEGRCANECWKCLS